MQKGKAFFVSFEVLLVLLGLLAFLYFKIDLSLFVTEKGVLILALISIACVTVVVYQSLRVQYSAKKLASEIAQGMFIFSRELFSRLYKESPVPYILIDAHGNITSTNLAAVRLFGIIEGEMDGRDVFELIEGDDPDHVATFSSKFTQGISVNDEEVRIIKKDGTRRWVMLSLFSFLDKKKQRQGLFTLVDITKQKQIDKAKTEFVSLASHQLRTPISVMRWNLELLSQELLNKKYGEALSEEAREYTLRAQNNLSRLNMLVDDFLNVSKFELGTLKPDLTPIYLEQFVAEVLEEHLGKANEKDIMIKKEITSRVQTFETDSHLLRMALGNLVSNAIKYTGEGGSVLVRVGDVQAGIVFAVADTGMGIPADEQDKVFSKIFRASNAKTNVPDGTGLGLYIANEAVKVLGGTIDFQSEEGVGTSFIIKLPI